MMMFFVLGFSEATYRIAKKEAQYPTPKYEKLDDYEFDNVNSKININ